MKKWDCILLENGHRAIAPEIITASRATDIPAFYTNWFFNRLEQGFTKWYNPFNGKPQYVSFSNLMAIVFWSKNPLPIIPYLKKLDKKNLAYYFQYTLNDYEDEGLEPGLPELKQRIETFKKLSAMIGKEKVIWRFDPLIITNKISVNQLLDKVEHIGGQLHPYTEKMVFSFADIEIYKKVKTNLAKHGIDYRLFNEEQKQQVVERLSKLRKKWNIAVNSCAEKEYYRQYGIYPNKCVDDELLAKLFPTHEKLMAFLGRHQTGLFEQNSKKLKDPGQRKHCLCIKSKDIGAYNTCANLCLYCYANSSNKSVKSNFNRHSMDCESIIRK